jgi:hypothetical protein
LALSKFDAGAKIRDKVEPGEYEIDSLVRVAGRMKVGNDHTAKQPNKIPALKMVAVLLSMVNGVTVEHVAKLALNSELDTKPIAERAQAVVDALVNATEQPRKGRVDVKEIELQAVRLIEEAA